jgi:hypothetical protein
VNEEFHGVRAFWGAYLLLAIRDMDNPFYESSAKEFVFCGERRPLGFVWTCEQLGIDASALRRQCMSRELRSRIRGVANRGGQRYKRAA